jgi:hypothetical protein
MFEVVAATLIPQNHQIPSLQTPAAPQVAPGQPSVPPGDAPPGTLQSVGAGGRAPPDRGTLHPPIAPRSSFS